MVDMRYPKHKSWSETSIYRWSMVILGWTLIVAAPLISWLPGPGGIALFVIGLGIILKHSLWAKKRYARLARLHPEYANWANWAMRRNKVIGRPPFPDIKRDIMHLFRRDDLDAKLP
jgi:hypothetical protein